MKKITIFLFSILSAYFSLAQTKNLTLDDAVLQQYRGFSPDKLSGFQWIPNTNNYVFYTDGYSKMMTASPSNTTPIILLNIKDLNSALSTNLTNFYGTQWVDTNTLLVHENNTYYTYSIPQKTGKKIQQIPQNADNATFDTNKQNLAFTINNNLYYSNTTQEKIAITNHSDPAIVSGQFFARNEFGINKGIFWSPKSSYLAFYQKDQTQVTDYPLLDITQIPGKLENIKYPMIGQTSEKPKVGIYHLASQKTVYITPQGNTDDYLTNLSWTPDEKYILIAELNRAQTQMNLNLYDSQTGAFIKTIITEKNNQWVEPEHEAYFPEQNSNNFVWLSEKNGFQNLYYYNINGKLIQQLTNNQFVATGILGSNPKTNQIYFTATGPNPTDLLAYCVTLKGKQTLITPNQGVHNVIINSNGNYFLDEYSNPTTPLKTILYNNNLKATTLLESKNKYQDYAMGTAQIKTIKSADGTTDLYTRLIKPSNFDPNKKYPVLVYVYGGPHAQMITNSYLQGASLWMYWMAEQGYLVYTLDNRGSENRGFAFESVIHRTLGDNEIEDQIKGIEYLKTLPYVDTNRLSVHGWSYGGFMATSLMLRKPDVFKVAVAGGPVTDWRYYEVMYGERYMDTPTENPKGFEQSSTLKYVNNLKGKLLLIHGTNDDVVVMQHSLLLLQKFIEAQKQVDFFAYPMHKHNVMGKDRVHLMKKILDYIIQNNK